ncbi:hypothetical protein ACU4GD_02995 [Cupriavidus basilensis]
MTRPRSWSNSSSVAVAPGYYDDWRERAWRERQWREQRWREHEWREHHREWHRWHDDED